MKIKTILFSLIFIILLIIGYGGFKNITSNSCQCNVINIFSDLYQKRLQSVVQIKVFTNRPKINRQGSGVIISKDGYIITNNHIIRDAKEIVVLTSDLKGYSATLIGTDPRTDIALLKINSNDIFMATKIGNSDDVRVGEWVVAMGSPFGLRNTMTAGIISGKNRRFNIGGYHNSFIQIDVTVNPGNSGGPLFNLEGELIGINTMIIVNNHLNSNIGFAIPINTAMFIVNELKTNERMVKYRIVR